MEKLEQAVVTAVRKLMDADPAVRVEVSVKGEVTFRRVQSRSDVAKKLWLNPEFRTKHASGMHKVWDTIRQDPEKKERHRVNSTKALQARWDKIKADRAELERLQVLVGKKKKPMREAAE